MKFVILLFVLLLSLGRISLSNQHTVYLPLIQNGTSNVHIQQNSSMSWIDDTSLQVYGEVWNNSGSSIYATKIVGTFYDKNNNIVATSSTYTLLWMIAPGQVVPFVVDLENAPNSVSRYTLSESHNIVSSSAYYNLTTVSQDTKNNNGVEVYGTLRNDNKVSVYPPNVAVTFYDSEGTVIFTQSFLLNQKLMVGDEATYDFNTHKDLNFTNFKVQAQGQ